ncbi:cadmium resistance transporter [Pseudomonas sp. NPDC089401]|uniref:cadmium resistance transporter n=1 Tax=Pseudomonas sp. NPDC089401 TaxID=3364462 RepID=UPI0037FDCED2
MEAVISAIVVFAVTNIDDIIILSLFFGDRKLSRRAIMLGQYVGIGMILIGSIALSLVAAQFPAKWISLLGFVPLGLGIYKGLQLFKPGAADEHATPGLMGSKAAFTYVTMMTISNGGDNTGVYVPLFASDPSIIPAYAFVFAVMTGVWCLLGYALVKFPPVAAKIERYGHYILPVVLIAIGLEILSGFFHG